MKMKMTTVTLVDPLSIEIPKKPANKSASEHRRATKPIMEKRRRARINNCLEQIKSLILLALNKDPAKHTKLEKADILEMTVDYLKGIASNGQQSIDKSSVIKSLKAGFDECASEVERFVDIESNMDLAMKRRLKSQLKSNFSSLTINNLISSSNNNNNLVSSTTSSPILSPLNMKTEPSSPLTINRDALTTISFNYINNSTKSQPDLTPPPSANSSNESFTFPEHFNSHLNRHYFNQQSNYIISPVSPVISDDGMDCTPVDCSKSSKLNLDDNVWRPW